MADTAVEARVDSVLAELAALEDPPPYHETDCRPLRLRGTGVVTPGAASPSTPSTDAPTGTP